MEVSALLGSRPVCMIIAVSWICHINNNSHQIAGVLMLLLQQEKAHSKRLPAPATHSYCMSCVEPGLC